jgi:serine/threonine-protein kinase RsbW
MARAQMRLLADERAARKVKLFLQRFCSQYQMPQTVKNAMALSLDEIISNIVVHGYRGRPGSLSVALDYDRQTFSMIVEDRGQPFDPTRAKAPAGRGPLAMRRPGGLGLLFVKNLMDDITYRRAGATNRLKLVKRLAP